MAAQPQNEQHLVSISVPQEDFAALESLAQATHASVDEYVRAEILQLAARTKVRPRRTPEEVLAIIRAAQEEFRKANREDRDPLAELIAERRREAALE